MEGCGGGGLGVGWREGGGMEKYTLTEPIKMHSDSWQDTENIRGRDRNECYVRDTIAITIPIKDITTVTPHRPKKHIKSIAKGHRKQVFMWFTCKL